MVQQSRMPWFFLLSISARFVLSPRIREANLALFCGGTSLDGQFVHVREPELDTQVLHLRNCSSQYLDDAQRELRISPKFFNKSLAR
jgi:hypothetical protein